MDSVMLFFVQFVYLLGLLFVIFGLPAGILLALVALCFRGTDRSRLMRVAHWTTCAVPVILMAGYLVWIAPWKSGVLTKGISPDGREYFVIQSFSDLSEPYRVSFYIRDPGSIWHKKTLTHQDTPWRSADVKFTGGDIAIVSRNGNRYREVKIPQEKIDLSKVLPGYQSAFSPAHLTLDQVAEAHH